MKKPTLQEVTTQTFVNFLRSRIGKAHYMLFKRPKVNRWIGGVFYGAPVIADLDAYRTYHLQRHKDAATQNDPDHLNYKNDPITHASVLRKVARDLSGTNAL